MTEKQGNKTKSLLEKYGYQPLPNVGKHRKLKKYLKWQWNNKHRTLLIPLWLAENYRINLGTEWDVRSITADMSRTADKALEEIRMCLMLQGVRRITSIMNPDHIPATSDDWSDPVKFMYARYQRWMKTIENKKARDATILFAKGERVRAIEISVKVQQGVGKGRKLIDEGIQHYVGIIRKENNWKPVLKPKGVANKKGEAEFVWTRIVNNPQGTGKKKKKHKKDAKSP